MLKKAISLKGWRIEMDTPVKVFVRWFLCRSSNEKPQLKLINKQLIKAPIKLY
jgi:hypothetical protein